MQNAPDLEVPAPPATTLDELRAELDRLDDAIHDLLMRRADGVAQIGRLGGKGPVAFRPGREAEIIRRLLHRHKGPLGRSVLVRMWRELLAGTTAMQGNHLISVCNTDPTNAFVQCAREHFGALTPMRVYHSPAQAIAEVSAGTATAAVLPLPGEEEAAPWWTALLHRDEPRLYVVARLPFWAPRPEGAPHAEALVLAAIAPDPSSRDRSLLGLELPPDMSRARLGMALTAAGFAPGSIILRREQRVQALVEVDGYVADDDARLAKLSDFPRPPVVLGAYAVPVDGENA
jgi:chorismate mutase